jgi:uncharacterized protein YndB with AHSA1/START domain
MRKRDYQPGEPGNARAERDGDRWTLVFVREFSHAPAKVWTAITDPNEIREWAPFEAARSLAIPGQSTLLMAGGTPDDTSIVDVRRAEEPVLLEFSWGEDLLRWELVAIPGGTRLTLRHTVADRSWVSKTAAGWHICFDVLALALDGTPIGRIVGNEAREYDWERLDSAYAAAFGIPTTGWPLETH